ncbi:ABC transporter substrate-binding protein [Hydrogenophaga sp. SL48]|uniref:ABC transporter substrate-binding protein n=1 Tax=Hydrogenophaga sp. SL48 TaxID=2806347 RepID=UPI001F32DED5|nr:ABC transporter substrate-binding protein [Hydrogenophaga sp. SL48]UJW81220.1 ABC transporter substrate-binding protein [Hydrogenophaga sp. SL48]
MNALKSRLTLQRPGKLFHRLVARAAARAVATVIGFACHGAAWCVEPIVVGQTYIGSGPVANFSTEPLLGIRAMLTQVNHAGGIGGRPVVLRQFDDANVADKAESNVRQLAKEGAVAILMPIGTLPSVGTMKAAAVLKVPVVGPYTGAQQVYAASTGIFPVRISFADEATRIVNHMALIGQTRIVAVRIDNTGAKVPIEAARLSLQEHGSNLLGEFVLSQDGMDADLVAKQVAALKPQGIFMSVSNLVARNFIASYRSTGQTAQFYSTSFLNGSQLHQDLGAAARGVVIMQVVPSPQLSIPLAAEFRASMSAIGATNSITYSSFEGYIAAKILVEALRKSTPPSPDAVQRALLSMDGYDLGGVSITFKRQGQGALNYGKLSMLGADGRFIH